LSTINERISQIISESGLSKTDFAKKISVSQQYVSKLSKDGTPSDRTISDICSIFNINDSWLRSGEGEMYKHLSRNEEISLFMGELMKSEQDDIRRRLISALSRLRVEEWEMIAKVAERLLEEIKKESD